MNVLMSTSKKRSVLSSSKSNVEHDETRNGENFNGKEDLDEILWGVVWSV